MPCQRRLHPLPKSASYGIQAGYEYVELCRHVTGYILRDGTAHALVDCSFSPRKCYEDGIAPYNDV